MTGGPKKLTIRIKTPANFVPVEAEESPAATLSDDSGPADQHQDGSSSLGDESSSLGDAEEAVFGM
jgi:hypothetical protein